MRVEMRWFSRIDCTSLRTGHGIKTSEKELSRPLLVPSWSAAAAEMAAPPQALQQKLGLNPKHWNWMGLQSASTSRTWTSFYPSDQTIWNLGENVLLVTAPLSTASKQRKSRWRIQCFLPPPFPEELQFCSDACHFSKGHTPQSRDRTDCST